MGAVLREVKAFGNEGGSPNGDSPTIRLLLAEPHYVTAIGLREVFDNDSRIEVIGEARSGKEAIRWVCKTAVDVLVTEMKLPDVTGIEVAQRLVEERVHTKALILTAYDGDDCLGAFLLDQWTHGYLLKDTPPEQILEATYKVAEGKSGWVSSRVNARVKELKERMGVLQEHQISVREHKLLKLLMEARHNDEIAETLNLSTGTVKNLLTCLYEKLGVGARTEAAAWGYRHYFAIYGTPPT